MRFMRAGTYVLIENILGTDKAEVVRVLSSDTIRQYVYDKVWPPQFNPNVTRFGVNKKYYKAHRALIRRFKGLHTEDIYDKIYARNCLLSSSSDSSDAFLEGECETFPPHIFDIIKKHKADCKPWYPPGKKPKDLSPKQTTTSFHKKVIARDIELDNEMADVMRYLEEIEGELEPEASPQDRNKKAMIELQKRRQEKKEKEKKEKEKEEKEKKEKEKAEEKALLTAIPSGTESTSTKIEEDKSETNIVPSEAEATSSKIEDDKAAKTAIIKTGYTPDGSLCTPWGMLRSGRYKNRKITSEMIENYVKKNLIKRTKKIKQKKKDNVGFMLSRTKDDDDDSDDEYESEPNTDEGSDSDKKDDSDEDGDGGQGSDSSKGSDSGKDSDSVVWKNLEKKIKSVMDMPEDKTQKKKEKKKKDKDKERIPKGCSTAGEMTRSERMNQ